MEDNQPWKDASPWKPVRDPLTLKILGKLVEELGELTSAVSRCIIQGIEERHPETGKSNRQWLLEELSDVYASVGLLTNHIEVTDEEYDAGTERVRRKKEHLRGWHRMAGGPPIGYAFELACCVEHTPEGLVYSDWMPRIAFTRPNVPEGSIRNLRELR